MLRLTYRADTTIPVEAECLTPDVLGSLVERVLGASARKLEAE